MESFESSEECFDTSKECFDQSIIPKGGNETIDCISPWSELNPNMFETFKKSQGISEDKKQNKEIVDFMLKGNDIHSEESLKEQFSGFPDYFYKYISQASQDKFKVLVKEAEKNENDNAIWSITREDVQLFKNK